MWHMFMEVLLMLKTNMQADNIIRFRQEVAAGRAGTQIAYMTTYLNSIERKSEAFFDGINGGRTSVTSPQGTERELDEPEGELHDCARGLSDGWGILW